MNVMSDYTALNVFVRLPWGKCFKASMFPKLKMNVLLLCCSVKRNACLWNLELISPWFNILKWVFLYKQPSTSKIKNAVITPRVTIGTPIFILVLELPIVKWNIKLALILDTTMMTPIMIIINTKLHIC